MTALLLLALLVGESDAAAPSPSHVSHPNIVVFLVDDLGAVDLGCSGSSYHRTPHIDRLAAQGVRFTQAYAAASVCSPTRAALLTGQHPVRVNITDWIPGMNPSRRADAKFALVEDRDDLALEAVTLAELLEQAGYARWFLGKWHLGEEGHWPTEQGFEVNIGGNHRGSPPGGYYAPWKNPTLKAKADGEYLTERLTDEAIALMQDHAADGERPFLLYLSYYNVHAPITPYRKRIDEFEPLEGPTPTRREHTAATRLRQDNPAYASMVAAVDDSVGRIDAALERLGLQDDTLVVFTSDNGGLSTLAKPGPTSNAPLRAGKGWLYEGGIRVPLIVRAPGRIEGAAVSEQTAWSCDLAPTLLDLAGLPPWPGLHLDGMSLVPAASGEPPQPRTLIWHYPHYHGSTWTPGAAIREGDWKLLEFYHDETVELYDLASDPGERHDLATERPDVRDRLLETLHTWQQEQEAAMPQPLAAKP